MNTQKPYSQDARREIPRSCLPLCDFIQCPGEHWRHVFPAQLNDKKPRGWSVLIKDMDLNARRVSRNRLYPARTLETLLDWLLVWKKNLSRISEQLNRSVVLLQFSLNRKLLHYRILRTRELCKASIIIIAWAGTSQELVLWNKYQDNICK